MPTNQYNCDECKGLGWTYETTILEKPDMSSRQHFKVDCFYCNGTGFATDEGSFEDFYKREL